MIAPNESGGNNPLDPTKTSKTSETSGMFSGGDSTPTSCPECGIEKAVVLIVVPYQILLPRNLNLALQALGCTCLSCGFIRLIRTELPPAFKEEVENALAEGKDVAEVLADVAERAIKEEMLKKNIIVPN